MKKSEARPFKAAKGTVMMVVDPITGQKVKFTSKNTIIEVYKKENVINDQKQQIGWGSQIRSYVLHPYKLIKDLRTNHESSNVNDVLDGEIDGFLEKSLSL